MVSVFPHGSDFAIACRKLFVLSAGGLKDVSDNSSDEIKAIYADVHKCMSHCSY